MAAEIVFGGGKAVKVPAADAKGLMQNLNRVRDGRAMTPIGPLPSGWIDVETEDGVIYVNPAQVAYVRDGTGQETPQVEETRGTLSGLEGQVARGNL